MTPEEFVSRLEGISRDNGRLYGRLVDIARAEAFHDATARELKGFAALSAAFRCFFLESIELINTYVISKARAPVPGAYALFLERLAHYFRTLRASEIIATQGYPMHGYTLLRNLYDSAILTSAVAQGKTDFYKLAGLIDEKFDNATFRKNRRKEENSVRLIMTGKDSGFSTNTLEVLAKWDVLFDDETHGASLTRSSTLEWLKGTEPLPILPKYNPDHFGMFMNRHCEIGWMVHRLLPLAQMGYAPLPSAWKEKWQTLDTSFFITSEALSKQLDKKIGDAIVELVKTKFPFSADSTFWS
jgi:hypothetical protein